MNFIFSTLIHIAFLTLLPLIVAIFSAHKKSPFYSLFSTKKRSFLAENNLTSEKNLILILQFTILLFSSNNSTMFQFNVLVILLLHCMICFSFLMKKSQKVRKFHQFFDLKFIILITIISFQSLFIFWQIYQDTNNITENNLIALILVYSIFFYICFKTWNHTMLILEYLIFSTYKILTIKNKDNIYFKHQKIFNLYAKTQAIANLWNFEDSEFHKKMIQSNIKEKNQKMLKNSWIMFVISCINICLKNINKTQKIIINGWKISLVE